MKNNSEKINNKKNNIPVENTANVEIKRKRGRPKKTENNNNLELKNKKNNKINKKNNSDSFQANNINVSGDLKNNKNNSENTENNITVEDPGNGQIIKHRGRPKGSTNTIKTTRPDRSVQNMVSDDKRKSILQFNTVLYHLPKVDKNNIDDIQNRTNLYFELCNEYNLSPTVAAYAMSLGIDRVTLWMWITNKNDVIKNPECFNILKNAYNFINSQYEQMLTEGKIVPVSAFFLMQNNHGYKQQTDHIITANTNDNVTDNDIYNRAALYD